MGKELTVINKNGAQVIDSREVAEMINKRHDHLIRDIKNYSEIIFGCTHPNIGVSDFFIESSYKDSTGRELPCYLLTKKGCDMVANKMTGEKGILFTAMYVTAFEQMRNELHPKFNVPTTFAEALRLAADQQEKIEEQAKLLEEQKPKVEFFDTVADSKTAISMNDVAKVLGIKGMGRNNLFEFLRNEKILMSNNVPFQIDVDRGYFRVIEQKYMKNGEPCMNIKTLVYQKGVDFISKTIKNKRK